MKNIATTTTLLFVLLFLGACSSGSDDDGFRGEVVDVEKIIVENTATDVPTLIVIMNWTNITDETDASFWSKKFFDTSTNGVSSVNRWYLDNTKTAINLIPVSENSGTVDDGVVIVDMGEKHPGKCTPFTCNDAEMRDTYYRNAINEADSSINFADYDVDNNNYVSSSELQILFIVAGGEGAYSGAGINLVWAHAWYYDGSSAAPVADGVSLMNYSQDKTKLGSYAAFGSTHSLGNSDEHKATIGIIIHELGHSLYDLVDLYDTNNNSYDQASGIGYYGIMSAGAWGQNSFSQEAGESPVEFSAFMKQDMSKSLTKTTVKAQNISLKCSSNEMIKLATQEANEYFLLECRDTQKSVSDQSLSFVDSAFTTNRLFAILYHIDEDKDLNDESGTQTPSNHYKVRVVQRDESILMTDTKGIDASFSHVYIEGQVIGTNKTQPYNGGIGYNVEVLSADYNNRTMTFKIQKQEQI